MVHLRVYHKSFLEPLDTLLHICFRSISSWILMGLSFWVESWNRKNDNPSIVVNPRVPNAIHRLPVPLVSLYSPPPQPAVCLLGATTQILISH